MNSGTTSLPVILNNSFLKSLTSSSLQLNSVARLGRPCICSVLSFAYTDFIFANLLSLQFSHLEFARTAFIIFSQSDCSNLCCHKLFITSRKYWSCVPGLEYLRSITQATPNNATALFNASQEISVGNPLLDQTTFSWFSYCPQHIV